MPRWGSKGAGLEISFGSLSQGPFPDLAFELLSRIDFASWSPLCLLSVYRTLRLFDPRAMFKCTNTDAHICTRRNNFEFSMFLAWRERKELSSPECKP